MAEAPNDTLLLGCCGAYCRTCRVYGEHLCRGCKTGYASGERELPKAKCKIKVCCIGKGRASCADCPEYPACGTIQPFHSRPGYKYRKYREAILFIRKHGYGAFFRIANGWTMQYGRYDGENQRH